MANYIATFIGGLFLYYFFIVSWYKFLNKKIDFRNYKFYIILILLNFFGITISFLIPQYLKVIASVDVIIFAIP